MTDCELIAVCPFFNDRMAAMPSLANMYKIQYCIEDNSQCARFRIYKQLGRDAVPADLAPSMLDEAVAILSQG